ncbi:hypothetical protein ACN27F_14940 [Solwaraspora sp. WMMB335]|uniref:hypothetical protein n=1 Tax=Solwaraspora sp. WMMB335 TaxID=3404118 RepID=UPI003B938011
MRRIRWVRWLTLGSWSWVGLASTVGMFDTDIEVVGPPELAAAFAALARRYATAGQPPARCVSTTASHCRSASAPAQHGYRTRSPNAT